MCCDSLAGRGAGCAYRVTEQKQAMTAGHQVIHGGRSDGGGGIGRQTLTHRVIYAWWHMRRTTARLVGQRPSDGYLLQLLLLSTVGFVLAWTIRAVLVPGPDGLRLIAVPVDALAGMVALRLVGLYVLAVLLAIACRALGGRGSHRETRIAVFWAALVAAPFDVAAALAVLGFYELSLWFPILAAPQLLNGFYWIGLLAFAWYLAGGIAQVHHFRSTASTFLYITLASLVAVLLALYLRAQGLN